MAIEIIIRGKDDATQVTVKVSDGVRKMGDEAEKQGSRLSGFFSGLKTVIAGAAVGVAAAIGGIVGSGLAMNNSLEQAGARIQAFTKDSEATADILDMVRQRAAATPFAFNEMADATAALLPVSKASGKGLEELLETAEILAASNPAEGLAGAAFALKEATSGDFTSIIERFNLPRQRLKELREQGVPDLEAVKIAMKELGLDTDLVTGLANTAQGRWSTFMDTLQGLAATISQPIFDAFSSGLGQVQSQLDANMPAIQAFASGIAGQIGGAIQSLIGFLSVLVPQVMNVWAAFQDAGPLSGEVAEAIGGMASAFGLNGDAVQQWVGMIQSGIATAQAVIAAVVAFIMSALATAQAFWAANGEQITASAQNTWNQVASIVMTVVAIVMQVLSNVAAFIQAHGAEIQAYLNTAWQLIVTVVTAALQLLQGIVTALLQVLQGDFTGAWETIQQMSAQFVQNLLSIFEQGGTLLGQAINLAIAAIEDAWAAFVNAAPSIGSGIIGGIVKGISDGVGALKGAVESAAKAALDAGKKALGIKSPSSVFARVIGEPIAQGMAIGITRGTPLVATAGAQLAGAAVGGAGSVQVGGNVGVSLSMNGNMNRYIDSQVDNRIRFFVDRGSARSLT